MIETRGRRVLVRDAEGERVCFLAGQRAVIGDEVRWITARGEGGKLVDVDERRTRLCRMDVRGKEQVLAANLHGLLVVMSSREPDFHAPLLHRYLVTADRERLDVVVILNKVDLGIAPETEAHLAHIEALGIPVLRTAVPTADGVTAIVHQLGETGPWALVGASGVGKTSLIAALLPDTDVGPVGEISEYWGTGRHTTTRSCVFDLPSGAEIADSPGIRTFIPSIDDPEDLRLHFPAVQQLRCEFRDCLHRPDEQGCTAEAHVPASLLDSYRALLGELTEVHEGRY